MKRRILITGLIIILTGIAMNVGVSGSLNKADDTFTVYPNPVTDGTLRVESYLKIEKVEILNIVGQVVFAQELEPTYNAQLNFHLQSGIYLLKVSFIDKTSNTKRIWVN